MPIAATESGSLCADEKLTAFIELQLAIRVRLNPLKDYLDTGSIRTRLYSVK
jgi:hypothetical protein